MHIYKKQVYIHWLVHNIMRCNSGRKSKFERYICYLRLSRKITEFILQNDTVDFSKCFNACL